MKPFTKDTFGYLFQVAVVIFLFSYSPVTSGNKANEKSYQKALMISKPVTGLKSITASVKKQIEPAVFNDILKINLSADKAVKTEEKNFTKDNTSEQLTEPFSISFPQIVLK
jgi:hypothetical protein